MRRYALLLILALAFLVRLYNVDSTTIGTHQWRQSQTAMIAENFHDNGYRFLYPQIDWVGDTDGYAETDFPIYSYSVALVYGVFGVSNWAGRLLSALFSVASIWFIYLIARKKLDGRTALWSAFFLSVLPLFAFYGRAVMPEALMLMASAAGIWFFSEWVDRDSAWSYFASAFFISLACLLKPTSLYLGLPLLYLAWERHGRALLGQWRLWAYSVIVVASVLAWYLHAHTIYEETGNSIGLYDKFMNGQLLVSWKFWNRIIIQRLLEKHFAWTGFVIFAIGLFIKRRSSGERLFDFWVASVVIYILIAAGGNNAHEYYQLPLILPAAVFMGKVYGRHYGTDIFGSKSKVWLTVGLAAFIVFAGIRYSKYMRDERPENSPSYQAAQKTIEKTPAGALIVAVADGDPTILYLTGRKGWVAGTNDVEDGFISDRAGKGAKYLVGVKWRFNDDAEKKKLEWLLTSGRYNIVYQDEMCFIADIS
ncbi:MAG: glycosyltransferase family 39 protein [Deltaproteobacteria bacterium]